MRCDIRLEVWLEVRLKLERLKLERFKLDLDLMLGLRCDLRLEAWLALLRACSSTET